MRTWRSSRPWCLAVTLVRVEGQRWVIVDAFETAKTELGLTHN
jgi:SRSO17 transposase